MELPPPPPLFEGLVTPERQTKKKKPTPALPPAVAPPAASMTTNVRPQHPISISGLNSTSTNIRPRPLTIPLPQGPFPGTRPPSNPAAFISLLEESQQCGKRIISNDVETADSHKERTASYAVRSNTVTAFHQIELLHMVLSFLGRSDLIVVRSVCKAWGVVAAALLNLLQSIRIDELLRMLGATKYDQEHPGSETYTLDFDLYDMPSKRLAVFAALTKTITKLDLNFTPSSNTKSSNTNLRIAPEVFMTLSVLCKKIYPCQDTLFTSLRETTVSQDLFSICPYAFSPMLFPSTIRTLKISDLGRVSIRTVFGYLASVASLIEECNISGDVEIMRKYKSFKASGVEITTSLRILKCKGLTDGWSFLQAISGGCPGLKELCVEFGLFIEESRPVWRKVTFPSLQTLTLSRCDPSQAGQVTQFYQSASFVTLKAITIIFTSELKADTMNQLLLVLKSSCEKTLQSLSLSVTGITSNWNSHHFQILGSIKNLRTLSIKAIGGMLQVEDNAFRQLRQNLPNLHSLIVDAELTLLTFNSLKLCDPGSSCSLTNLVIPINGSTFSHYASPMVLPPSLLSLSLKIVALEERDLTLFAASIASVCPSSATVVFNGSPSHLICSLKATFLTLHAWRRDSEERTKAELRSARMQMMEMKKMYEQALTERDRAIRRQKSLEVMIGNVFSDESVEEL